MTAKYKKLLYKCIALATLLICLIILPVTYHSKVGMTQVEYDKAMADASDAMLYSKNKTERQIAVSRANNLIKYKKDGRIEELKDYTQLLSFIRFGIILTIFIISWSVLKPVYREINIINSKKQASPGKSSAGS